MSQNIRIFTAKDDPARLYVIKDENGITFNIMCDQSLNAGFFTLSDEISKVLVLSLGVPNQCFNDAHGIVRFVVEKEQGENKKISIFIPGEGEMWVYLTRIDRRGLIEFLNEK